MPLFHKTGQPMLIFLVSVAVFSPVVISHVANEIDFDGPEHIPLRLGEETTQQVTECDQYTYFVVNVNTACDDLNIQVKQLKGEPNVYVSRPTITHPTFRSLSWSSYEWGSENITISSRDPHFSPGKFYIAVHAYCGSDVQTGNTAAQYTILARTIPHIDLTEDIFNKTANGVISANEYKYHRFCLPLGCHRVKITIKNCNDPHACPNSYSYPEMIISPTVEHPTVKSYGWMLGEVEHRSLTLNIGDAGVKPGHYYIGVYGWCTPDNLCPNENTCGPCRFVDHVPYSISVTTEEECSPVTDQVGSPWDIISFLFHI